MLRCINGRADRQRREPLRPQSKRRPLSTRSRTSCEGGIAAAPPYALPPWQIVPTWRTHPPPRGFPPGLRTPRCVLRIALPCRSTLAQSAACAAIGDSRSATASWPCCQTACATWPTASSPATPTRRRRCAGLRTSCAGGIPSGRGSRCSRTRRAPVYADAHASANCSATCAAASSRRRCARAWLGSSRTVAGCGRRRAPTCATARPTYRCRHSRAGRRILGSRALRCDAPDRVAVPEGVADHRDRPRRSAPPGGLEAARSSAPDAPFVPAASCCSTRP